MLSAADLEIVSMPLCRSYYVKEIPDLVYTNFNTFEREIVVRNMTRP